MSNKPYAVVYFTTEDMYSEIPTSWLRNEEECYWPQTFNARKLMQKGQEPDVENWEVHKLRIEGYSSTLEGARRKAIDSEYSTSNEGTQDAGRGRRKKLPNSRIQDNVDCSSDEEEEMTPPPTPKMGSYNKKVLHDSQRAMRKNNIEDDSEVMEQTIGNSEEQATTCDEMEIMHASTSSKKHTDEGSSTLCSQNSEPGAKNDFEDVAAGPTITLKTSYEEIVKLRKVCSSNKLYLSSIYNNKIHSSEYRHDASHHVHDEKLKVPLKTIADIQEFELKLENADAKISLSNYFKSLGGRDGRDLINRCLAHFFTNELATQVSWFGQRGNFKAKDLNAMKILTESVRSSFCVVF